jgi:hypothetical protein
VAGACANAIAAAIVMRAASPPVPSRPARQVRKAPSPLSD